MVQELRLEVLAEAQHHPGADSPANVYVDYIHTFLASKSKPEIRKRAVKFGAAFLYHELRYCKENPETSSEKELEELQEVWNKTIEGKTAPLVGCLRHFSKEFIKGGSREDPLARRRSRDLYLLANLI